MRAIDEMPQIWSPEVAQAIAQHMSMPGALSSSTPTALLFVTLSHIAVLDRSCFLSSCSSRASVCFKTIGTAIVCPVLLFEAFWT